MDWKRQPVTISKGGFAFCRYTVAAILWFGWIFKQPLPVVLAVIILALSAALTIRRAPLIVLYDRTLGRRRKSGDEEVDLYGMRFAHTMGAILGAVCLLVLYAVDWRVGWGLVFLFCILKTVSAVGLCPASKLYGCMSSGTCCAFLRKKT